ncbi:AraC family transcriptional regulator [Phytohalomonas tamaricis]|uniref:AraC family transcriptional regulator n=1 Tax=Phytohalomonas tamaricis TaxID=2081032 RepID=UPI00131A3015|nr:AraC family transcriptional regulator [Phytohalomonas tamaricis]
MKLFAEDQVFRFGETTYERGGSYGPLRGPYLWLAMLNKGRSILSIDGREIVLHAGEACLVCSREQVIQHFPSDCYCHASWCETGEFLDTPMTQDLLDRTFGKFSASTRLKALLATGLELEYERPGEAGMLRDALARSVFYECLHYLDLLPDKPSVLHRSVEKAKSYIERHFASSCSLEDIAAYACFSRQHLTRLFNEQVGTSPIQYLWQVRLGKAEEMLIQSTRSMADIAFQCGFKNPCHFSRMMREHFGHSPRELRQRYWARMPATYRGEACDVHY